MGPAVCETLLGARGEGCFCSLGAGFPPPLPPPEKEEESQSRSSSLCHKGLLIIHGQFSDRRKARPGQEPPPPAAVHGCAGGFLSPSVPPPARLPAPLLLWSRPCCWDSSGRDPLRPLLFPLFQAAESEQSKPGGLPDPHSPSPLPPLQLPHPSSCAPLLSGAADPNQAKACSWMENLPLLHPPNLFFFVQRREFLQQGRGGEGGGGGGRCGPLPRGPCGAQAFFVPPACLWPPARLGAGGSRGLAAVQRSHSPAALSIEAPVSGSSGPLPPPAAPRCSQAPG